MDSALEDLVRRRAQFRCEYCLLPAALASTPTGRYCERAFASIKTEEPVLARSAATFGCAGGWPWIRDVYLKVFEPL
jgi:hypothetical protein